ncbi:hypothetical protein AAC387_Pa01g0850 [Persea americana]
MLDGLVSIGQDNAISCRRPEKDAVHVRPAPPLPQFSKHGFPACRLTAGPTRLVVLEGGDIIAALVVASLSIVRSPAISRIEAFDLSSDHRSRESSGAVFLPIGFVLENGNLLRMPGTAHIQPHEPYLSLLSEPSIYTARCLDNFPASLLHWSSSSSSNRL